MTVCNWCGRTPDPESTWYNSTDAKANKEQNSRSSVLINAHNEIGYRSAIGERKTIDQRANHNYQIERHRTRLSHEGRHSLSRRLYRGSWYRCVNVTITSSFCPIPSKNGSRRKCSSIYECYAGGWANFKLWCYYMRCIALLFIVNVVRDVTLLLSQ